MASSRAGPLTGPGGWVRSSANGARTRTLSSSSPSTCNSSADSRTRPRIERFRLDGQFAVWIEGLHAFVYKPHADYTFHTDRSRLAADALVVQHDNVMVRLEGRFDKATAIAIARSLHG